MSSIETFNPNSLMLQTDDISITARGMVNREIKLIRPNADFLWLLGEAIGDRLTFSTHPETAKGLAKINYSIFFLIIAARERMLSDEDARWVEATFEAYKTTAERLLAQFQLFKAFATLAAALQAETPEILRDERKAWSQSILRVVEEEAFTDQENSAKKVSISLRDDAKILLSKEGNPFKDDEPELKLLITFAKELSFFDGSDLNHLKSLKKQVRQALDRFRRSLLAEANFKRKDKRYIQTFVTHGKHYYRGTKCHINEVPCTEPLSVSGGTPFAPSQ